MAREAHSGDVIKHSSRFIFVPTYIYHSLTSLSNSLFVFLGKFLENGMIIHVHVSTVVCWC